MKSTKMSVSEKQILGIQKTEMLRKIYFSLAYKQERRKKEYGGEEPTKILIYNQVN